MLSLIDALTETEIDGEIEREMEALILCEIDWEMDALILALILLLMLRLIDGDRLKLIEGLTLAEKLTLGLTD